MSLIGLLLSLAVVSATLGGLVVVSDSLRADNAEVQTRATLRSLRAAMLKYLEAHRAWPPAPPPEDAALKALLSDPAAGPLVHALPVRVGHDGSASVHDGYGHAIRFQVSDLAGGPDFVSAGADGRFGDPYSGNPDSVRAANDDLLGSEQEVNQP